MLDKDRVYSLFLLYADLEEPQSARLRAMSDAAADALLPKLSDRVCVGDHMERLCNAAATLAFCDWGERSAATALMDAEEIRVGDVTLRASASSKSSYQDFSWLREEALADIADLLRPPFVLGQVKPC